MEQQRHLRDTYWRADYGRILEHGEFGNYEKVFGNAVVLNALNYPDECDAVNSAYDAFRKHLRSIV
jgi:hypothetical protein